MVDARAFCDYRMKMRPGFVFAETMRGSFHLLSDPARDRAIAFTAVASAKSLRGFARDPVVQIEGDIDAEGIAKGRPLRGSLGLKLLSERRLPYRLTFAGEDGAEYELRGQKDWSALSPIESMTTLPASLYDARGAELARATLRFDLRSDLFRFLRSFRLRLFR